MESRKESFEITHIFTVSPEVIYNAWLDSDLHTAMTGGEAICSNKVGEKFNAWDGYISGKNSELMPHLMIVQTWRTTEFSPEEEDSLITVHLKKVDHGTEFTLIHTHIPQGQTQYKQGWKDYYLSPMDQYFSKL